MMAVNKSSRDPAMDIIRCTALLCVVGVHFFLNSGFYDEPVLGPRMYLMTVMRSALMVCVPLFLMLSGYLMKDRRPTRSYYRKIGRTLGIYLLASLACIGYEALFHQGTYSFKSIIGGLLAFEHARYCWYVEMYIGLFLLIPFLNALYRGLESRRQKQYLLLVLLILTALPGILNIHRLTDLQWWLKPSESNNYQQLIPDWWTGIYPVTYYFLGCYLREYPLKLKRSVHFVLTAAVLLTVGIFNCYRSSGYAFNWGDWQDWGALPVLVQTVLVFSFLAQGNYSRLGTRARGILARMSGWTLGAYLVSSIFDDAFYAILNAAQPDMQLRLNWFIVIVPAVYICSMGLSALLNGIWKLVEQGTACICRLLSVNNRRLSGK